MKKINMFISSLVIVASIPIVSTMSLNVMEIKSQNSKSITKETMQTLDSLINSIETTEKNKAISNIITVRNKTYDVSLDYSLSNITETKEYTANIYLKSKDNLEKNIIELSKQNFSKIVNFYVSSLAPLILITFEDESYFEANNKILSNLNFIDFSISEISPSTQNMELSEDLNNEMQTIENNREILNKGLTNYEKYIFDNAYSGNVKVGVLEVDGFVDKWHEVFSSTKHMIHTMKSDLKFNETSDHATAVASLINGKNSITDKTEIYSATTKNKIESIEWMIRNGIKLINHSYGRTIVEYITKKEKGITIILNKIFHDYIGYSHFNYYLDYISQRYDVTNVFSAGNDADETFEGRNYEKIEGYALSPNVITVGAFSKKSNIDNRKVITKTPYSEFGIETSKLGDKISSFTGLPKPIIVAEDDVNINAIREWTGVYDKIGTSFSAPRVTASLSIVDRKFKNLKSRVYTHMAILAASGSDFEGQPYVGETKTPWLNYNGFDKKVGAGKINNWKLHAAAANTTQYEIPHTQSKFEIYSKMFHVNHGKTISIGLAWLYNAGYNMFTPNPWQNDLYNYIPYVGTAIAAIENANSTKSRSERQIDFKNGYENVKGIIYSDFDVYLENYNGWSQKWVTVGSSTKYNTNVERLVHKAMDYNTNSYRIRVVKYKSADVKYAYKSIDKLSLSYVVWDEKK
ncbi:subtilase family protein [Mycoplasma testudineum]|uniref:Subtilase family protein n=1 Tax=Mycoplasma testudineum TaxID=244584 RepID=A0A4R6IGB2_9MOLU|nr:S8 family serine peptidase [Mycoplasma testudineum]OYD27053.1 hypothetical protein CG473_00160 [Mycoplasma testudineum]TDO21192.1 subtilase family protein [Mycoplasma testudineum]